MDVTEHLPSAGGDSADKRLVLRARLERDFRIDAAFVGVPKLARILGLAPSTIYGHVRGGCFFIPHRMMNTTVMFLLEDVVEWMCSEPASARQPEPQDPTRLPSPAQRQLPQAQEDIVDRAARQALSELGLEPGRRRHGSGVSR